MPSGRKRRIMIACVTFETTMVTDPIEYYEINRAHIIHYIKNPEKGGVYAEFYDRVCEIIRSNSPREVEIVEHNERVSDFTTMLRTVLGIIQSERDADPDCDIYVNTSSGSSEYAAASAIASMMMPGTVPFSVNTKEYTVSDDMVRDLYYVDGKPVGLTKATWPPKTLPSYAIDIPEEHLVRGLRILDQRNESRMSVTSGRMVEALKSAGIWYRDTEDPERKSNRRQAEAVYYQRDFIAKWVSYGWIEKDQLKNRYVLTEKGRNIIDTFYVE